MAVGTQYAYTLSGVSATDVLGGSLSGYITVASTGKVIIPITLREDATTEGAEVITMTVAGQTVSVNVNDTSLTPPPASQTIVLNNEPEAKTGGAGDDVFRGTDKTLVLDKLDGGLGTDTLVFNDTTGGVNLNAIGLEMIGTGVEVVEVRSIGAVAANTTGFSNVTALNATFGGATTLVAAATTDVGVANGITGTVAVDGGKNVVVTNNTAGGNITIGATTVNAGTVTVTDVIAGATIAVDGGTNVSITATGATNLVGSAVTVGAGGAATDRPTGAVEISNTATAIVANAGATAVQMGNVAVTGGSTVSIAQNANGAAGVADNAGDLITQGAVTVTAGNATSSVNVVQSDQATGRAAVTAVAAVRETATVTFSAMGTGDTVTVDGLTFTASKALTANQVAEAFAGLTASDRQDAGGTSANGLYTVATSANWTSGAASGAVVTFTAVTAVAGNTTALVTSFNDAGADGTMIAAPAVAIGVVGVAAVTAVAGVVGVANGAVTINDTARNSITSVTVDGYGAGANIGNTDATTSLDNITTLTLKNSGTGTATLRTASTGALTLNLTDVDAAVSLDGGAATLTALTINTTDVASTGAITAATAQTVTINAAVALSGAHVFTAATAINVNGTAAVNLTGATTNAATLTSINASGNSGGVTAVLGGTNDLSFTGGTGADVLTLGNTAIGATRTIDLGDGNDTLTIATGTTAATIAGTVRGGNGTDTLAMGYAAAEALSVDNAFQSEVQGFERLTINNVTGVDNAALTYTVNLANLAYNYVTVNGTNTTGATDTLALTGMAANGTVAFGGLSTAGSLYTVALANSTGTPDALNFVLASTATSVTPNVTDATAGTAINAGTVTSNGVEIFNISSSAVDVDGATNVIAANGNAVTTVNLSGNGGVSLTSTASTLRTVDASGLTGNGANGRLEFTASNANMTVTGGAGHDAITIAVGADSSTFNGGAGNDTFAIAAGADLITLNGGLGNDIFDFNGVSTNKSNFAVVGSVNTGDKLDFAGIVDGTPATTFTAAKITLSQGASESTQAYLDQAMTSLAENGFGWFQHNGNTYVAGDVGADSANAFSDGNDFVVMIVGLVDLSAASFNATTSTMEIA